MKGGASWLPRNTWCPQRQANLSLWMRAKASRWSLRKMPRKRLTKLQRARLFQERGGLCCICGSKIIPTDEWDVDHVIPLALGGEDVIENMHPAHRSCHRGVGSKTSKDIKQIAKAKRQKAYHETGRGRKRRGRKLPSRPFPKRTRPSQERTD